MSYTTNIANSFNFINNEILKLTQGQASLCDYDSFQKMLAMWIIPDHIPADEVEQYVHDFHSYLQYQFADELEDIYDDLQLVTRHLERKTPEYAKMSNNKIVADLINFNTSFQNLCETTLYNIRLKLNEIHSSSSSEIALQNINTIQQNYCGDIDDSSSSFHYEEEPTSYRNEPYDHGVIIDSNKYLKLTKEACDVLIDGCVYEKKWINSDFLHKLAETNPDLWMSCEYFELYEKAVLHNWDDIVSDFRSKNPSLRQFCDFFERGLRMH